MFRLVALVCVSALALAPAAPAQQAPEPKVFAAGGLPPAIGVVDGIRGGKLIFRQVQTMPSQATRNVPVTRTVVVDGKEQEKTEYIPQTYTVMKTVSVPVAFDLAEVRVFDTDSMPIPPDRLVGLFAQPRMVLYKPAGSPAVDPAYLKIARDGTPFLAFPPPPGYGPLAPAPAPAPTASGRPGEAAPPSAPAGPSVAPVTPSPGPGGGPKQ